MGRNIDKNRHGLNRDALGDVARKCRGHMNIHECHLTDSSGDVAR